MSNRLFSNSTFSLKAHIAQRDTRTQQKQFVDWVRLNIPDASPVRFLAGSFTTLIGNGSITFTHARDEMLRLHNSSYNL